MPGSGKSTAGVLAAKALCMDFIDCDLVIQKKTKMTLQQYIDSYGFEQFEKTEEEIIRSLECDNAVIATGGSAVYYPKAMEHLGKNGKVIYLHLEYETMKGRIENIESRGIVFPHGQTLREMYDRRLGLYNKYCDEKILCDKRNVEETVSDIVKSAASITKRETVK